VIGMKHAMIKPEDFPRVLQAARDGDFDALGAILEASRAYLLFVANERLPRVLAAKFGASDAVQDTFVRAQECFGQFRGSTQAELLSWLRQGLVRQIANQVRAFGPGAKRDIGREVRLSSRGAESTPTSRLVDTNRTPEAMLAAKEETIAMRLALQMLDTNQRFVVGLRFGDKLSWAEIGKQLDISSDAARKHCTRALMYLGGVLQTVRLHRAATSQKPTL
jgi:RNA polymerase sigma-70 factor, ECF subfamily